MTLKYLDPLRFSLWSFITVDKEAEGGSGDGKPAEGAAAPPGGTAPPEPTPGASPPKPDGRDNRIKALVARQHALQADLDAARAALPKPAPSGKAIPIEELPAIVEQAAGELAERRAFDAQCAAVAMAGFAAYGEDEFKEKIGSLTTMRDPKNPTSAKNYDDFLAAIVETDEPARVIAELADNMDEALRVYNLPLAKRAVAIAKLGLARPKPGGESPDDAALRAANALVSSAPKPIKPLTGGGAARTEIGASDERSVTLPMDEWVKRRNAEIEARPASRFQRRVAAAK